MHAKSLQLCPALCDSMDCSPPGSSVHGILQAGILERVAIPFSRGSSQSRDLTGPPALQADSLSSSHHVPLQICNKLSAKNTGHLIPFGNQCLMSVNRMLCKEPRHLLFSTCMSEHERDLNGIFRDLQPIVLCASHASALLVSSLGIECPPWFSSKNILFHFSGWQQLQILGLASHGFVSQHLQVGWIALSVGFR